MKLDKVNSKERSLRKAIKEDKVGKNHQSRFSAEKKVKWQINTKSGTVLEKIIAEA